MCDATTAAALTTAATMPRGERTKERKRHCLKQRMRQLNRRIMLTEWKIVNENNELLCASEQTHAKHESSKKEKAR